MKILSVNTPSENEMEIEIGDESHTFGVLLSRELLSMEEVELAYYVQEHPLKNTIRVYLKIRPGYKSFEVLEKAIDRIKKKLDEIERGVMEVL